MGGIKAIPAARTASVFKVTNLAAPTISPALRQKVAGAYDHIASLRSYPTLDLKLGPKTFEIEDNEGLPYAEHEHMYNSMLLGTMLNSLVNGSMIYFGPPGSGKTTTPEVVGQVLFGLGLQDIQKATIYGHPNLTEEKMTASFDVPKLMKGAKEVNWLPWVTEFYRMLDEANRIPPEITSILMQAIDRRRISYAGEVFEMPAGPVFATANYYDAGNFEMTPPFLDRFGISVTARGLNPRDMDMLYGGAAELDRTAFRLSHKEREQVFSEIQSIGIEEETLDILEHIASGLSSCELSGNSIHDKFKGLGGEKRIECRKDACPFESERVVCSQVNEQGLTTRSLEAMRDYGRALAWFMGRERIDEEIMKTTFALANMHRLSPSKAALSLSDADDNTGAITSTEMFQRKTFDFCGHVWEVGKQAYMAQQQVYEHYRDFISNFYVAVAEGNKTPEVALSKSEEILAELRRMQDPAKWDLMQVILIARRALIKAAANKTGQPQG